MRGLARSRSFSREVRGAARFPTSVVVPPVISGVGYTGQTLTSDTAAQWYADGVAITGETGTSLVVTSAFEGAAFTQVNVGGTSNEVHNWVPSDGADVSAWYDALDVSTVTQSGGFVSQWGDKSGNGRNASQSTASRQPTYNSGYAQANNQPAVVIPNVNNFMGLIMPTTPTREIFCVAFRNDTTDATFDGLETILSGTGSFGQYRVMANHGGSGNSWYNTNHFQNTASYKNGVSDTSPLPLPLSTLWFRHASTINQAHRLGYNDSTSDRGWKGGFCEWIFLSAATDTSERQTFEGYLHHKWNITASLPVDHPYKTQAPTV